MAKLGIVTLTGASGRSYVFDVYHAGTTWKDNIACVYYISKAVPGPEIGGNHTQIYIGQTDNMKERHSDHHKQECFRRHGCNAVSIHLEANENTRLLIEADLVKALKPPCNG